jgi:hypothetical protein
MSLSAESILVRMYEVENHPAVEGTGFVLITDHNVRNACWSIALTSSIKAEFL